MSPLPMRFQPRESLLVLITMIWGATFLVTRIGVGQGGPFGFLLLRFSTGVVVLAAWSRRDWANFTVAEVRRGVWLGLVLFASYSLQTTGLQTVSSGKSAFITALYVPMVPLLQWAWLGHRPRRAAWVGVSLAFLGLALLSIQPGMTFTFDRGEWLTLGGSVAIAAEILLIGRWSPGLNPRRWALCQMTTVMVVSFMAAMLTREPRPTYTPTLLSCAIGLGLATGAIQVGMNWAQQSVSPTRATLIYALEPVWAGLIGWAAGESLTRLNILGAGLIIVGVLTDELWPTDQASDR